MLEIACKELVQLQRQKQKYRETCSCSNAPSVVSWDILQQTVCNKLIPVMCVERLDILPEIARTRTNVISVDRKVISPRIAKKRRKFATNVGKQDILLHNVL